MVVVFTVSYLYQILNPTPSINSFNFATAHVGVI